MGLKYADYFSNDKYEVADTEIIICRQCSTHLCLSHLVISDGFRGSTGPAFFVDQLINYHADPVPKDKIMRTGTYLIKNVHCNQCMTALGWMYSKAYDDRESYKEGKFVIEQEYIKLIPNNSGTKALWDQARRNSRRRRSLALSVSTDDMHSAHEFSFGSPCRAKYSSRVRDKVDEDDEVFVDV